MSTPSQLQLHMFSTGEVCVPQSLTGAVRVRAGPASWVDHVANWLTGADALFECLADIVRWEQHQRPMYSSLVVEPRLVARYSPDSVLPHPSLAEISAVLSARYGRRLDRVSLNFYRDRRDSVAWHGDRIGKLRSDAVVAIVSVGAARPFLLRPTGGGPSRSWRLGHGDLLVMGGACQLECEHSVPKSFRPQGPRISVMFRHGPD